MIKRLQAWYRTTVRKALLAQMTLDLRKAGRL